MDEYVGLPKEHPESYHSFMFKHFFDHVDIPLENINILNGMAEDVNAECERYEEKIRFYGKIHLFMGGSVWMGILRLMSLHLRFLPALELKRLPKILALQTHVSLTMT